MKSARLIKQEEQSPPLNFQRVSQPTTEAQAMRAVVTGWVQEHQAAQPRNPRQDFAALFASPQQAFAA